MIDCLRSWLLTRENSINICHGIDPYTVLDSHRNTSQTLSIPASMQTEAKLHDLWATAMKALTRHPLLNDQKSPSTITPLVGVFDGQICDLASQEKIDLRTD